MTLLMLALWTALRVWITPSTLSLAPGETQNLQVEVEEQGTPVTPDTLWFEVLPPRLGWVEQNVFHAREPGIGVLRAVVRVHGQEAVGHAALQIGPHAHRLRIEVNPREVTLAPQGEVPFQIRVLTPEGREAPHASLEVQVVPPWLGNWQAEGSRFQAGPFSGRGMLVLVARDDQGRTGIARARIRVGQAHQHAPLRIRVIPPVLELSPGASQEIRVEVPGVPQERLEVFLYPDPPELGTVQQGSVFQAGPDSLRGVLWVAVKTPEGRTGIRRVPVSVGRPLPRPRIHPERLHARPHRPIEARLHWPERLPTRWKHRLQDLQWQVIPRDFAEVRGRGPRVWIRVRRPGVGLLVARWHQRPVAAAPIFAGREVPAEVQPTEVHVGDEFRVTPVGAPGAPLHFAAVPPHRVEHLGEGRFHAKAPGEVWVLMEGEGWGSAVRIQILP